MRVGCFQVHGEDYGLLVLQDDAIYCSVLFSKVYQTHAVALLSSACSCTASHPLLLFSSG